MLTVERLIEEGHTVVAIGGGETTHSTGEAHRFVSCDVFTFAGDKICCGTCGYSATPST